MRLTVIGCSGSFPGPDGPASCYLVEAGGQRLLLDLGSGALGPLQRHADLDDVDAVLLSHLHPDHCLDLCGYLVARRHRPGGPAPGRVPVHGPEGTAARMARAYDLPLDPGMTPEFDFRTWSEGEAHRFGPVTVTARPVVHPVPAYGLRVEHDGRVLAYSGDTDACPTLVELARDADLFLCEAAFVEGRDQERGTHLTGRRAGEAAAAAGARRLVLTHLPPWNDPAVTLAEARAAYPGPVEVAGAGTTYDI